MNLTPRRWSAVTLFAVGLLLIMIFDSIKGTIGTYPPIIAAALYFISPLSIILIVLAAYRFLSKGKDA